MPCRCFPGSVFPAIPAGIPIYFKLVLLRYISPFLFTFRPRESRQLKPYYTHGKFILQVGLPWSRVQQSTHHHTTTRHPCHRSFSSSSCTSSLHLASSRCCLLAIVVVLAYQLWSWSSHEKEIHFGWSLPRGMYMGLILCCDALDTSVYLWVIHRDDGLVLWFKTFSWLVYGLISWTSISWFGA